VLVKEVDNYWLIFEIHFWVQYTSYLECAAVQSEILEVIGDLYRPLADDEKPHEAVDPKGAQFEGSQSETSPAAGLADDGTTMAAMQKMGRAMISKRLKRLGSLKVHG